MRIIKNILLGACCVCVCHGSISGDKQGIEEIKIVPFEAFKVGDHNDISRCDTDGYNCKSGAKIDNNYFFITNHLYKDGYFSVIDGDPISFNNRKGETLKEAISKLSIDWLQQQKDKKGRFLQGYGVRIGMVEGDLELHDNKKIIPLDINWIHPDIPLEKINIINNKAFSDHQQSTVGIISGLGKSCPDSKGIAPEIDTIYLGGAPSYGKGILKFKLTQDLPIELTERNNKEKQIICHKGDVIIIDTRFSKLNILTLLSTSNDKKTTKKAYILNKASNNKIMNLLKISKAAYLLDSTPSSGKIYTFEIASPQSIGLKSKNKKDKESTIEIKLQPGDILAFKKESQEKMNALVIRKDNTLLKYPHIVNFESVAHNLVNKSAVVFPEQSRIMKITNEKNINFEHSINAFDQATKKVTTKIKDVVVQLYPGDKIQFLNYRSILVNETPYFNISSDFNIRDMIEDISKEDKTIDNFIEPYSDNAEVLSNFFQKMIDEKVKIINISSGIPLSRNIVESIKKFIKSGGIIIKSAGNAGVITWYQKQKGYQTNYDIAATTDTSLFRFVNENPSLKKGFVFIGNLDHTGEKLYSAPKGGSNKSSNLVKDRFLSAIGDISVIHSVNPAIKITGNNNKYEDMSLPLCSPGSGTSYAAPLVSAVVALLYQAFPDKSAQDIVNVLLLTADPLGDDEGMGRINIKKAYESLKTEFDTKSF